MRSKHRDEVADTDLFTKAAGHNELPSEVVINKSSANNAGLKNINILMFLSGLHRFIDILKVKYFNKFAEQDHHFIKKKLNL